MALHIETISVGQLAANCYLVRSEADRSCIIIDPGDDADLILRRIETLCLKPTLIALTHGHFDHLLAAVEAKAILGIPIAVSKKDEFLVQQARSSTKHWLGIDPGDPPQIDRYLKKGDRVSVGEFSLEVIETPGHTPGSVCIFGEGVLFSGDLLFHNGIGRTDFSYSSESQMRESLKRVLALPPDTAVYPGHGPATTIGEERTKIKL